MTEPSDEARRDARLPARRLQPANSPRGTLTPSGHGGGHGQPSQVGVVERADDISVVLVYQERLFAEAIHSVLKKGGLRVSAVATTAEDGMPPTIQHCPDVAVLSSELPDMSTLEFGQVVVEHCPDTKVLMVCTDLNAMVGKRTSKAGLSGCVSNRMGPDELLRTIRAVAAGQPVPSWSETTNSDRSWGDLLLRHLTVRERQVLALLAEGASSRMLSRSLQISENTARTHVQNLLNKLQVGSRLEAVAYAIRHGLVEPRAKAGTGPVGRLP